MCVVHSPPQMQALQWMRESCRNEANEYNHHFIRNTNDKTIEIRNPVQWPILKEENLLWLVCPMFRGINATVHKSDTHNKHTYPVGVIRAWAHFSNARKHFKCIFSCYYFPLLVCFFLSSLTSSYELLWQPLSSIHTQKISCLYCDPFQSRHKKIDDGKKWFYVFIKVFLTFE